MQSVYYGAVLSGGNLTGLNASNLTTGTVGISNGGTGATTALQALANLGGASLNASVSDFAGALSAKQLGAAYQVDQFSGSDIGAKLTACIAGLSSVSGGICDARNFSGTVTMSSNVTLNVANTTVLLPCATISTASQFIVPGGVRNVTLKGCGLRGASTASGSQGRDSVVVFGAGAAVQVGDPTYAVDTMGFHLDDAVINVTGSANAATTGVTAYRVQEIDLKSLYFLGNGNQTGLVVDGTGNYADGCFYEEWQMAGSSETGGLVKHFFPWWMEGGYRSVPVKEESLTEEEQDLIRKQGLDLEQVGYRRELKGSMPGLARQEFVEDAENCFRVSGES